MMPIVNKPKKLFIGIFGALVISLGGVASAASIPAVATLDPIVNGLRTPIKTALDSDGSIYVADPRSGGVVVLNKYGMAEKVLHTSRLITSIALLNGNNTIPGGKVLVGQGDYVAVLDQNGTEVGKLGVGAGQFITAAGMAVAPNGSIYVVDSGAYKVKVFTPAGTYSSSFGSYGIGLGVFQYPTSVAVITETTGIRIAVVDTMGGKVDIFSPSGIYTNLTYGSAGALKQAGPLRFTYPSGIAFEYANGALYRVYVVDMFQGQIQAIDPSTNQFLGYVGSYGYNPGNLLTPSDCVFDQAHKRLLVANGLSNIVSFGIDGGQNPVYSIPPVLTINQSAVTVSSASVVLSGTVDPGCSVVASADTTAQVGAVNFPFASSWQASVDNLKPGINVISITARSSYGTSTTKTATIQYLPPTAAFTIGSFDAFTSQPTVILRGTADPGSYVYVGNTATGASGLAEITASGAWTYTLTLAEGYNDIEFTVTRSGASAGFNNIAITLDTHAPLLTISALSDGSSTANQVQNISGIALDPNLVGVTVNGVPTQVNNGSFSYALPLVKGPNLITVLAGDRSGNQSINSRTINFVPALPRLSVSTPADGTYTNVQDITVSGSVDKTAAVTVNGVAANPAGGLAWAAIVRLVAGINTIDIAATDEFASEAKEKRTIIYDAVAPVITITSPSQDIATNSPGLTIKGTLSDDIGIKGIKAAVNGADKQVTLDDGKFTLLADFTAEGTYTVAVSITDLANNVSTAKRSIVYDHTAPLFTVDPFTVPYPATLSGTVEAGATVMVTDAAGSLCTVVDAGEKWTCDLSGRPYDPQTLRALATDAAGNRTVVGSDDVFSGVPPVLNVDKSVISVVTNVAVLTGTVDPGCTLDVTTDAQVQAGTMSFPTASSWSLPINGLVPGNNVVSITATNSYGKSTTTTATIQYTPPGASDTDPPKLAVSALSDGDNTTTQVQNIFGTVIDPNLAGITVNDIPVQVNNGMFSYAIALVKGANSITVIARDTFGNTAIDRRTITFSPALPILSVTSPADNTSTKEKDVTVTGKLDKAAAVKVNGIAANPGGGLDWSATVRLVAGINTIEIAATDAFASVAKEKRTITYDPVAPVITITSPSQDIAVNSPSLTIKAALSDDVGLKGVNATVNGVNADNQVTLGNGEFTLFAGFEAEGTYTIAVTVTDLANNVSTALRTIVYDKTPPVVTVDKVAVPYPFMLSGTVEAGATVVVKDAAGSPFKVAEAGQKWSADLSGRLYDPATLAVQATDAAGNNSATLAINPPVPDGDMNLDGQVTIADALTVIRLVVFNQKPTNQQLAHGDIGPLLNGKINPKGRLDVVDAILILRKAIGLQSW